VTVKEEEEKGEGRRGEKKWETRKQNKTRERKEAWNRNK
jgi:hypothetical protein